MTDGIDLRKTPAPDQVISQRVHVILNQWKLQEVRIIDGIALRGTVNRGHDTEQCWAAVEVFAPFQGWTIISQALPSNLGHLPHAEAGTYPVAIDGASEVLDQLFSEAAIIARHTLKD